MTTGDALSPDTGEVLRTWLGSAPQITSFTGSRIGLNLSSQSPSIRYALVSGENWGGGAVMVTWQVECWGPGNNTPDDGTAHAMARTVMALAPTMNGPIGGANVSGATADLPYSADDPVTGRPRDIVEVTFSATP